MKLTYLNNIFYLTQYIHTNLLSILKLLSYLTFFFHIKFQIPTYFTFKATAGLAILHVLGSRVWEWPLVDSGALGQEPRFGFTDGCEKPRTLL